MEQLFTITSCTRVWYGLSLLACSHLRWPWSSSTRYECGSLASTTVPGPCQRLKSFFVESWINTLTCWPISQSLWTARLLYWDTYFCCTWSAKSCICFKIRLQLRQIFCDGFTSRVWQWVFPRPRFFNEWQGISWISSHSYHEWTGSQCLIPWFSNAPQH